MTLYGNNCLLDLCWDLSFSLLFEQIESPMMKFSLFSALLKFFAPTKLQGCLTFVLYWLEWYFLFIYFFSIWVFFCEYSWITGLQWKMEGVSLTPHYHLHLLHRNLDISWAITAESSPLYIPTQKWYKTDIVFMYLISAYVYIYSIHWLYLFHIHFICDTYALVLYLRYSKCGWFRYMQYIHSMQWIWLI